MYAELIGNYEKYKIKSLYDNKENNISFIGGNRYGSINIAYGKW